MRVFFLANYAPHAMKGLIQGSDREAAVTALAKSVGGKFESYALTRGAYDVVVTVEMPDQAASMGLAMAIRASGAFTEVVVLEQLEMGAVVAAAEKAAKSYKPAG